MAKEHKINFDLNFFQIFLDDIYKGRNGGKGIYFPEEKVSFKVFVLVRFVVVIVVVVVESIADMETATCSFGDSVYKKLRKEGNSQPRSSQNIGVTATCLHLREGHT